MTHTCGWHRLRLDDLTTSTSALKNTFASLYLESGSVHSTSFSCSTGGGGSGGGGGGGLGLALTLTHVLLWPKTMIVS